MSCLDLPLLNILLIPPHPLGSPHRSEHSFQLLGTLNNVLRQVIKVVLDVIVFLEVYVIVDEAVFLISFVLEVDVDRGVGLLSQETEILEGLTEIAYS